MNRLNLFSIILIVLVDISSVMAQGVKSTETFNYPQKRTGGVPVSQLADGEEYVMQNSNTTLSCRNLYWEWDTYLRTRSDGKPNDVTFVAHQHVADGKSLWSFQVSSETGNGMYLAIVNGSNAQTSQNEEMWAAIYTEGDSIEGSGFVLTPDGATADEGHELQMNGTGDWVVSYADGASTDRTAKTSHWSFIRTADLDSRTVTEYNAANLRLYQYLVETSQMYDRGITAVLSAFNAGVAIYNKQGNTTDELLAAIDSIEAAITKSAGEYEKGVPATYGIVNPSFENQSSQYDSQQSVPFGWVMKKNGNIITSANDWSWCGCNADAYSQDGTYIWGIWHWGDYGDVELSQTIKGLPNGIYKLSARLMNNNTEKGNLARIFAGNSSMLAGGAADYDSLPDDENCNFGNSWATSDRDMSHVMAAYAQVADGTLTIGAKSNGFFKIDDFQLTYLGQESVSPVVIGQEQVVATAFPAPVNLSSVIGVKACIVDNEGNLKETDGVVASGQPILLLGEAGNYDYNVSTERITADTDGNLLRVANGDVYADGKTYYILCDGEYGFGFYLQEQGSIISNGQVYLLARQTAEAEFLPITSESTGITATQSIRHSDKQVFDLSGRRASCNSIGIIIVNGKKILVKHQ